MQLRSPFLACVGRRSARSRSHPRNQHRPRPAALFPRRLAGRCGLTSDCAPAPPTTKLAYCNAHFDETARNGTPLVVPPGTYRVGSLKLATGAHLLGIRGTTRLMLTQGPWLLSGIAADHATLSGLILDGAGLPLPERCGLAQLENCKAVKITQCEIKGSGRNGLVCISVAGEISENAVSGVADAAIRVDAGRSC